MSVESDILNIVKISTTKKNKAKKNIRYYWENRNQIRFELNLFFKSPLEYRELKKNKYFLFGYDFPPSYKRTISRIEELQYVSSENRNYSQKVEDIFKLHEGESGYIQDLQWIPRIK